MTDAELKKLRAYYRSLLGQQRVYEGVLSQNRMITSGPVALLNDEIRKLCEDFPDLVPSFSPEQHVSHRSTKEVYYRGDGILSYLSTVLGRLEVAIEESETVPVTEIREFGFIRDKDLRKIIERDYLEIQRAYIARCWKSVIILCGSAIETVLTDLLLQDAKRAESASQAPKHDISRWDLADLINVSVELKGVSGGVEKLSHSIREYRNLVHPGNEIRNKLAFGEEEAKISIEVLHIIHRDLSK